MLQSDPLVSVIIPTYKRSEMLLQAIDSVLFQTYANVEVIVVDDNDPHTHWRNDTEYRMKKYKDIPNVKYLKHLKNKNGSAARNTGIQAASGIFLCFLDDDDCYYADKIEKQVKCLLNSEAEACYCDYKKNGQEIIFNENEDIIQNILLGDATPQTSGWMIKKTTVCELNGFDESYYRLQDYEFLLRFFRSGFKMVKVNEVLYERNISNIDNIPSGEKIEKIKNKLYDDFSDFVNLYSLKDKNFRKKMLVSLYGSAFKSYFKEKKKKDCLRMLFKCCKISVIETICYYYQIFKSHL